MGCSKCKHLRLHKAQDICDMPYYYCMALPSKHCFERDMKLHCKGNLFEAATERELYERNAKRTIPTKKIAY